MQEDREHNKGAGYLYWLVDDTRTPIESIADAQAFENFLEHHPGAIDRVHDFAHAIVNAADLGGAGAHSTNVVEFLSVFEQALMWLPTRETVYRHSSISLAVAIARSLRIGQQIRIQGVGTVVGQVQVKGPALLVLSGLCRLQKANRTIRPEFRYIAWLLAYFSVLDHLHIVEILGQARRHRNPIFESFLWIQIVSQMPLAN